MTERETFTGFCREWNERDTKDTGGVKITPFEQAGDIYWAELRFPKEEYACKEEDFNDFKECFKGKARGTASVESTCSDFNSGVLSLGIYCSNTGDDAMKAISAMKDLLEEMFPIFRVA